MSTFNGTPKHHCESSPGSSDECRLSAGWQPTLRPSQPTWTVSLPEMAVTIRIHHRHLLLFSPKADTHFTVPRRVEGWVVWKCRCFLLPDADTKWTMKLAVMIREHCTCLNSVAASAVLKMIVVFLSICERNSVISLNPGTRLMCILSAKNQGHIILSKTLLFWPFRHTTGALLRQSNRRTLDWWHWLRLQHLTVIIADPLLQLLFRPRRSRHSQECNNNNRDDIYGAVVMAKSLREFTRFIWWMQTQRRGGR